MTVHNGMPIGFRQDYPYHFPYKLRRDEDYERCFKECVKAVRDGMTPSDAAQMVFRINRYQWSRWVAHAEEDIMKGFTEEDSRLIELVLTLAQEHLGLRRQLERRANKLALDDSNDMLKFLLERRHGYIKQSQKDLEVSAKEEAPIKFEFVDMQPTENED